MRIYLDNCCYNRPFDDQNHIRISLEAQAKLYVQSEIRKGKYALIWSYVLDYETSKNPFEDRRTAIVPWRDIAVENVAENDFILQFSSSLQKIGVKAFDALHIACAIDAGCDYFLTTDDHLLRRSLEEIKIVNPIQFISEEENM